MARQFSETMNVRSLCDALEQVIIDQPLSDQLRVVAEGIEQLIGVYAERATRLIDGYERRHNPQEPIVDLEGCVDLFVQTLQLDVTELMKPEEGVQYPAQRRCSVVLSRVREEATGGVVGVLDQAALLAQLDQRLSEQPGMTEAEAFNQAIATAHDEDVSAWAEAIAQGIRELGEDSVPLLELQEAIALPSTGMPLVKMWLALLLGGYEVKQLGGFYEVKTIWVTAAD
jgi:hypothetical protein